MCFINRFLNCTELYKRHSTKTFVFFLGERYYATLTLWHEPSVCRLAVTLLHPTQILFGNIFAPSNSLGTRTVCTKILGRHSRLLEDRAS